MPAKSQSPATDQLDAASKALLTRLQSHVPLVPRPFLSLAGELGLSEAEAIERTAALCDSRFIRQIGAIFDGRMLGYDSCLVAARYEPAKLEAAAHVVSSHPGVSHNYQRDHAFNLWFTIAVPPGQSLQQEVDTLGRLTGAKATRLLPATRMFKLGVRLEMDETPGDTRGSDGQAGDEPSPEARRAPSDRDIQAVRAFQDPFVVGQRPFDAPARLHGFASTEDLLEAGEALLQRKAMRRFSAVLRHREAGFQANGMVVWTASPEECLVAGPRMATFAKVSHCYQRPTYDDWPYSLFTMIHGRTADEVQECIVALQAETGLREYRVLYSSVEFKKARVRYFTDEWDAWRRETGASLSPASI